MQIPITNLIFALSAGLQERYESCQIPARKNPSQLSLTWTYPQTAQNLWDVQAQNKAHVPPLFVPQTASQAGIPQGLKGDRWNTLTFAFSLPYPVSTILEQVMVHQWTTTEDWVTAVGDGSRKVFDNSVKIKSICRLFRNFSSRFLS